MDKLVDIKSLNVIGKGERGDTFDFSLKDRSDFILITRHAGSFSGNTYHKGVSSKTNPKIFVLLNGVIVFRYRHINKKDHSEIRIDEPSIIKIPPYVTHSVEAITDYGILECNSIMDIQNDREKQEVVL